MPNLCLIGLQPRELGSARLLVTLLRHPDPVVGELTRQALRYLEGVAARAGLSDMHGEPPAARQSALSR